jgi:Mpv17/PMP22 family protein
MGVMEGRDLKHIRARFEDIYRPALLANWKIWPAAQASSTYVLAFRTLLTNGCDSLSILDLCPYPIVFHFNKPVAYSGHSTCLSSTPREPCFSFWLKINVDHQVRVDIGRVENKTRKTPKGAPSNNNLRLHNQPHQATMPTT